MIDAEKISKAFDCCINDECSNCPCYKGGGTRNWCEAIAQYGNEPVEIPRGLLMAYIGQIKNVCR